MEDEKFGIICTAACAFLSEQKDRITNYFVPVHFYDNSLLETDNGLSIKPDSELLIKIDVPCAKGKVSIDTGEFKHEVIKKNGSCEFDENEILVNDCLRVIFNGKHWVQHELEF